MQSQLTSKSNVVWTNLQSPEPDELASFVRDTALEPVDAEFLVHNYHRPEITVRPQYVMILLHVPVFNRQTRVTTGAPLYIIIKENHVWTLHYEPIVVLEKCILDFQNNEERQEEYFQSGPTGLALYVLNVLLGSAFNKLDRLNKHINIAEDAIFNGHERKMVEEISILTRDVLDFRKIIRPQLQLFASPPAHALMNATFSSQWLRLHGQVNKLWEILESLFESTRELGLTNGKLLQLKESSLLQLLTYYSILSIPVFLFLNPINPSDPNTSLQQELIYWSVLGALVLILVTIFLRFKGKRVL
ncbi:MAG: CorA family divalent cation transporter [Candidatus Andersenbacteria bacterium]